MQPLPLSNSKTFSSPQKAILYPLGVIPHFPLSWATTNLLSVSVALPVLGISYKWNLSVWPFVSDLPFYIMVLRFIHVVAVLHSFLSWHNISIVWIYHILCISLLFDGHLDYFHFLALMNSAAMNIFIQVL